MVSGMRSDSSVTDRYLTDSPAEASEPAGCSGTDDSRDTADTVPESETGAAAGYSVRERYIQEPSPDPADKRLPVSAEYPALKDPQLPLNWERTLPAPCFRLRSAHCC